MTSVEVVDPGPFATIQDLGRPGFAHLAVGRSGACDRGALRLANRLVGNDEGAAVIEATAGGLVLRARGPLVVAVTGALAPIEVDGREADPYAPVALGDGAELRLGRPSDGLRTYVAARGGIDVPPVLGSRSTDVLAGIGPPPLAAGAVLPVGATLGDQWRPIDVAPIPRTATDPLVLRVVMGPRHDWFGTKSLRRLAEATYEVTAQSNRIGLIADRGDRELPSEGLVAGALQVPPSGQPTLMLADHPVTGGYPVIAVVLSPDLDAAGQAWPGQRLRFRVSAPR
jgi:biotin-dependent carboxylase-like uncharacterized protein